MTEFASLSMAPTKEQHDRVVAKRRRNFTDWPMRDASPSGDGGARSGGQAKE